MSGVVAAQVVVQLQDRGMAYRSKSRGWFFRTKQPHHITFLVAFALAVLGILGARTHIQFVSHHAFWFMVAAYVVLALGNVIDGL
jgi:hypothetical protein